MFASPQKERRGRGAEGGARDEQWNKGSIHAGGYLDVNRQPSVAVDRLLRSRRLLRSSWRLTGDDQPPLPLARSHSHRVPGQRQCTAPKSCGVVSSDLACCLHRRVPLRLMRLAEAVAPTALPRRRESC